MTAEQAAARIERAARARGFAECGIAAADPTPDGARLRAWLAEGMHGGMGGMAHADVREDPARLPPGARSVVVRAWTTRTAHEAGERTGAGRIASYARFPDYHRAMRRASRGLLADLRAFSPCRAGAAPVLPAWTDAAAFLARFAGTPRMRAGQGRMARRTGVVPGEPAAWAPRRLGAAAEAVPC